jgi:transposase
MSDITILRSPPYLPHLKPIEHCFSLIKHYVKELENNMNSNLTPAEKIYKAFTDYSIFN